jgi:hypothetical protein
VSENGRGAKFITNFVWKMLRKRIFGRSRLRWEENIKLALERGFQGEDCIHLSKYKGK